MIHYTFSVYSNIIFWMMSTVSNSLILHAIFEPQLKLFSKHKCITTNINIHPQGI